MTGRSPLELAVQATVGFAGVSGLAYALAWSVHSCPGGWQLTTDPPAGCTRLGLMLTWLNLPWADLIVSLAIGAIVAVVAVFPLGWREWKARRDERLGGQDRQQHMQATGPRNEARITSSQQGASFRRQPTPSSLQDYLHHLDMDQWVEDRARARDEKRGTKRPKGSGPG